MYIRGYSDTDLERDSVFGSDYKSCHGCGAVVYDITFTLDNGTLKSATDLHDQVCPGKKES